MYPVLVISSEAKKKSKKRVIKRRSKNEREEIGEKRDQFGRGEGREAAMFSLELLDERECSFVLAS